MNEDKVFLGNTPTHTRSFMAACLAELRADYDRLVIPACGQMAMAFAALEAGWSPSQMFLSDVSLFSAVLGCVANGESLDKLGITIDGVPLDSGAGAPEVLYWLKLYAAQHQDKHYFQSLVVRDMRARRDAHLEQINKSLEPFSALKGIQYASRDMWEVLEEYASDARTVIWVNPPGYKRGYARMFDTAGHIAWAEPAFDEFEPNKGHDRIRDLALATSALWFWYRYNVLADEDKPFVVCADQKGLRRWDYILTNRPERLHACAIGRSNNDEAQHRPVLPGGHEVTAQSKMGFQRVDIKVALYYRDLFAHRLALTQGGNINFLLILDGFVAGVVSMSGLKQIHGDPFDSDMEELFGFTAPVERYPKMNRLLMMLIKCDQFLRQLDKVHFRAAGVSTSCITQYPELKINRGIYDLIDRKRRPDGMYDLRYRADRTKQTYREVLLEWLTKYA